MFCHSLKHLFSDWPQPDHGQQGRECAAEPPNLVQEWLRVLQQRWQRGPLLSLLQGYCEEEASAPHQHASQLQ